MQHTPTLSQKVDRPAVLALAMRDDRFFLIRRRHPPRAWSPPGGYLEGRTAVQAARAEAAEESGLEVKRAVPFDAPIVGWPAFALELGPGRPAPNPEAEEWRWATVEELRELSPLSPPPASFEQARALLKFDLDRGDRLLAALPSEFVVVPSWLSSTGSFLYSLPGREPHDVDMVVRGLAHLTPQAEKRLSGAIEGATGLPVHWCPEEIGPVWSFVPLYDLVARRREIVQKAATYHVGRVAELLRDLPPQITVLPAWLCAGGDFLTAAEPSKLALLIPNAGQQFLPQGVQLKIRRLMNEAAELAPFWLDAADAERPIFPLYDLVARRRPRARLHIVEEPEFAARFYKAALVEDAAKIKPLKPLAHYQTGGEFYAGDEELVWEKFARRASERGVPLIIQQKLDGMRLHIHVAGGDFALFSDGGFERSHLFPGLKGLIGKLDADELILDCEFMELEKRGGPPVDRWKMAWIGSAKEPPEPYPPVRIIVHDLIWLDGKNLAGEPYSGRLAALEELLSEPLEAEPFELAVVKSKYAETEAELRSALRWAAKQPGSEGAMLKFSDFRYKPGTIGEVAKFKRTIEIDGLIIGWRKIPAPRPAGTTWTRAQAMAKLEGQLKKSRTYIFRVALKLKKGYLPLESDGKLTSGDLELDFDEQSQRWKGTDDPKLWTMCSGFPHRQKGDYRYGNTYACALEEEPQCGQVITVAPAKIRPFQRDSGDWGLSWIFPRAKQIKPQGVPGEVRSVLRAFKLPTERFRFGLRKGIRILSADSYPDEEEKHRFVLQLHFRGRSCHGDLRFQLNEILEGWTISFQIAEAIKEPVVTMAAARREFKRAANWKIDFQRGEMRRRKIKTTIAGKPRTIVRRAQLRAVPKKAEIPADWISVEGVTERADPGEPPPVGGTKRFPGVFLIADKGEVEFGSRRPWFFEYFLNGKHFNGRWVLRAIERKAEKGEPTARDVHLPAAAGDQGILPPGVEEQAARKPFYWTLMQPKDQTPYVLSQEAEKKGWLPPSDVSALPKRIREAVPKSLRYWEASGQAALERRRTLADEFEELGGPRLIRKGKRQIFGSPGGKRRMAKKLLPLIPPHKIYVEPMAGGAALFWKKSPGEDTEVLADIDRRIMFLYRFIRDASEEELRAVAGCNWKGTKKRSKRLSLAKPTGGVQKAYQILYLFRHGWHKAGRIRPGQSVIARSTPDISLAALSRWQRRLQGVKLHQWNVTTTLEKYDGPDTFFYIDPPFLGIDQDTFAESQRFDEEDWLQLKGALEKLSGKFLLSLNHATFKTLSPWPKRWHARKIMATRTAGTRSGGEQAMGQTWERIIANYPLSKRDAKKAAGEYVLQRHWFRGQVVIRWGPSSEHWDLRVARGPDKIFHLVLMDDPRRGTTSGYKRPAAVTSEITTTTGEKIPVMEVRERVKLKPGTEANPTKETPGFLETVAHGSASVLEEGSGIRKFKLSGLGVFVARRESADSSFWELRRSAGPVTKRFHVPIRKVDEEKQLVYGVVLKPEITDSQGDRASPGEIERAAHQFLRKYRLMDERHRQLLTSQQAVPVESYIAPTDLQWSTGGGRKVQIPAGAWVLVTHIADGRLWREVKAGKLNAYSIVGRAQRIPRDAEAKVTNGTI